MKKILLAAWLLPAWLLAACVPSPPPSSGAPAPAPAPDPVATARAAVGAACLTAAECESGICEGQGCTPDAPGHCAAKVRPCTRDFRDFCGCDGKTFHGSGTCPGQRFSARAACAGSTPPTP